MKKMYSITIAIAIVIAMTGIVSAPGIDSITIGGDTQGQSEETKSVTVDVSGMSGVGALQIDVTYDPAVIIANTVAFGPAATGALAASNINNQSGKVTIGIINETGISGSGNLATISFTVVGNAGDTTALQIVKKNLSDSDGFPVTTEPIINNGTFTVIGQSQLSIVAPSDITETATGLLTIIAYLGEPNVTGGTPPYHIENDAPPEGFPLGTTTVTWTVTDSNGVTPSAMEIASDTQLVTIIQEPANLSITAPADITKTATGSLTVIPDLGTPTITGGTSPYNLTNDAPAAGFPLGTTTVTWTVTDSIGTTASDIQSVKITETAIPTPTPPVPELSTIILTTAGVLGLLFIIGRNRR